MSTEKLSRIIGLRLLSIKEGAECGKIQEVVLDSQDQSVRYFVLDTGKGCFGLKVLPTNLVTGMGKDYATTDSVNAITDIWDNDDAMSLAYTDSDLCGGNVVSSVGDILGRVKDFEFDAEEGHILSYELEDGSHLPARDVVTLSRGYVFVNPEHPLEAPSVASAFVSAPEEDAEPEEEPDIRSAVLRLDEVVAAAAPVAAMPEPIVTAPVAAEPVVTPEPVAAPEEPVTVAEPEPVPAQAAEAQAAAQPEKVEEEVTPEPEPAVEIPAAEPASEAPARRAVMPIRRASAAAQPAAASGEAGESPKDMRSYFEKRRTEFLIGRVVNSDILAADGTVLIAAGQAVTAESLELVRAADKITELTMTVG